MKLTREVARDLLACRNLPDLGLEVESDEYWDHSRWESIHQLVVKDKDGRLWAARYRQGLTEYQDIEPFEDQDEVEFYQVEKIPVTTYEYRRVT